MSIGLLNLYSTRNLGDAAIYAALAEMCPEKNAFGVLSESKATEVTGLRLVPRLPACDAYVSVGGEIFNNARQLLMTKRFVGNIAAISRRASQTMLFGQSIPGSCNGLAFGILSTALKRLPAVVVRDINSHARLQAAGVDAELSYDAAFTLAPEPAQIAAAHALLSKLGLSSERLAVISLRGHSHMYSETGDHAERAIASVARRLLARGHQVALIVQADSDYCDSDWTMCKRIRAEIPGIAVIDPIHEPSPVPAWELLAGLLAIANLVVAVRYHTAVLRLAAGRKALILYYANKGKDLCERLGQPGMPLSAAGCEDAITLAEQSASGVFDPEPLARDVLDHFNWALGKLGAAGAMQGLNNVKSPRLVSELAQVQG